MKRILVTGSNGFIGKNLIVTLKRNTELEVLEFDLGQLHSELEEMLNCADVVYHLAGVNRPEREEEFNEVNAGLTGDICSILIKNERTPKIVFSSSIQVERNNPYGNSKLAGEEVLKHFHEKTKSEVVIFRLNNVFGKWCRPNYNSVVATFCHNIARNLPITISNPKNEVPLVYIDDVVNAFVAELDRTPQNIIRYESVKPDYRVSLEYLVQTLNEFKDSRQNLHLARMDDEFVAKLYATYLSYLPEDDFGYNLGPKYDDRGSLAEFIKSPSFGQMFVSRTKPGITRGNHYHHTKVEKFFVVDGKGVIRFRSIIGNEVFEYPVDGKDFRVVDIPPGYTHSIENVGNSDMIVLFWASEIFDPERADTYFLPVCK